jgi:hypothetical protein
VLKKNRKKLQVDPARREPAEALKAEFEGSMGKLAPLQERIGQMDELIDRGQGSRKMSSKPSAGIRQLKRAGLRQGSGPGRRKEWL